MRRTTVILTFTAVLTSGFLAGCGDDSSEPRESFQNGTFTVGVDIREGKYATEGATDESCRYEITPQEGSGSSASLDKGEKDEIELSSGDEVTAAGCEEFVRQ